MFQVTLQRMLLLTIGAVLAVGLACRGGDSPTRNLATSGAVSVTLMDGPAPDYREINLNIQKVEIHSSSTPGDSGWLTLAEPNRIVDLLTLRNGLVATLVAGKTLEPGRYQQLRLVLGDTGNTLKLADGSTVTLEVPSAQKTGLKVPLSFEVKVGTTADIWIDFDGAHSIQVRATGGPTPSYLLRPVLHAFEKVATGSLSGSLTGPGGVPLAGAVVTAQTVDGSGNVSILQTTQTTSSGTYILGLLPLDQAFFIVTQPVIGTTAYPAQASAALTLTSAAPTASVNFTFAAAALSVGGVNGSVTPMATSSQSDTVLLLQAVPTGAGQTVLAVASVNGFLGTATETYAFTQVPAGAYWVQALRVTLHPDGTTTLTRSTLSPGFSVNNGASTVQNLGF